MSPKPGRVRPRRTPRLGHCSRRAAFTIAQRMRRSPEYRRLIALTRTPEGAVAFMREYFLVAPVEGAAAMRDWYAWFCRTESPTVQEQARAAALVSLVLHG